MISSAVVIPEEQSPITPSSPTSLKRRQSSFSTDSNKRLRIETDNDGQVGSAADERSPDYRNLSATPSSAVEEKKRGKRLFGALLGTLSQTSSKPAHKKRDEIEQRQRERLKRDNKEREEEARRKKEDLDRVRRVEQKTWDMESTRIRHRYERTIANFLQTKTEPKLYYRPWDLRPDEEEQIKKQLEDVEYSIRSESIPQQDANAEDEGTDIPVQTKNARPTNDVSINENQPLESDTTGEESQTNPSSAPELDKSDQTTEDKIAPPKEDDQGGGELVEGREDDVMY